ncbi:hypothetical protein AB0C52_35810 [Streptomyces sp. NPDC048717]|uniref:hypothetical protein n=1 Tax=Streptomyces sp. NPDC048717 TaxID=3154928 RepID=UPI003427F510
MTYETPRDADGAKICAWCGGPIRQSGVGRSRDYCSRTHKEYAYRARRDGRLIAAALAAVRPVSTTVESLEPVSPVVETVAAEDFLLAPPVPAPVAPAPAAARPVRRQAQVRPWIWPVPLWDEPGDGERQGDGQPGV